MQVTRMGLHYTTNIFMCYLLTLINIPENNQILNMIQNVAKVLVNSCRTNCAHFRITVPYRKQQ